MNRRTHGSSRSGAAGKSSLDRLGLRKPYRRGGKSVASDPRSSYQVRRKGKTLKALHRDQAYFGDRVEMNDFGSTIGVGGVIGSNFTWPVVAGPASKKGGPS